MQTTTELTKRCPWCAEEILVAAKKCKHCSELLPDLSESGWFPDPSGHQYRYWDGIGWTEYVSDGGAVAVAGVDASTRRAVPTLAVSSGGAPKQAGPICWYEPLIYVAILAVWFTMTIGVATVTTNIALNGHVPKGNERPLTLHEKAKYVDESRSQGQVAGIIVALVAMAAVAMAVGYRLRDAFMLLIPIWGLLIMFKLLWRLACLKRRYWAPAPA
jgi:hypothetical protein